MKITTVFRDSCYPMVEAYMNKNRSKYEKNVKSFIKERIEDLNDIGPYSRITHTDQQKKDFWKETGLDEKAFKDMINRTYFANMAIKPSSVKDPMTICLIHIVRYYYKKKMKKELELAMIHLTFSGYFYPLAHYISFNIAPYKHVMDYVINNKLTYKYDIKKHGTILKSMTSLDHSWLLAYTKLFDSWEDDDVVYLVDQLTDRIKSFMKNIATIYYEAHKSEEYLMYSSDNIDDENFRLADSNTLKTERIISNTMNYINSSGVNFSICKASANNNVNLNQAKNLIEIILSNKENLPLIREMVSIMVSEYFKDKPKSTVVSAEFVVYSIKPRPNTNNKQILRLKEIQQIFLKQSDEYLKRMKRPATQLSYIKTLQTYVTYCIYNSNV